MHHIAISSNTQIDLKNFVADAALSPHTIHLHVKKEDFVYRY